MAAIILSAYLQVLVPYPVLSLLYAPSPRCFSFSFLFISVIYQEADQENILITRFGSRFWAHLRSSRLALRHPALLCRRLFDILCRVVRDGLHVPPLACRPPRAQTITPY